MHLQTYSFDLGGLLVPHHEPRISARVQDKRKPKEKLMVALSSILDHNEHLLAEGAVLVRNLQVGENLV